MRHLALAFCLTAVAPCLSAHADTFRYTFSFNQPDSPTFFSAESPTLITDSAVLATSTCSDFLPGLPHPTPSCDSIALQHLGANAVFGWAVYFNLGASSVGSLCCVPSDFFDLGSHESPSPMKAPPSPRSPPPSPS